MKAVHFTKAAAVFALLFGTASVLTKKTRRRGSRAKPPKVSSSDPTYNSDDIFEAISVAHYGIPKICSKEVLEKTMERCVLIWRQYCRYEHCIDGATKIEWPPTETESWRYQRPDVGWKEMENAWKWSGKCAYNATQLWRIFCGGGNVVDPNTGVKDQYKYWFLVSLDVNADSQAVEERCIRSECTDGKLKMHEATQSSRPVLSQQIKATPSSRPALFRRIVEDQTQETLPQPNQDILDALGPRYRSDWNCSNDALTTLLERCIIIWHNYCRCAECDEKQNCAEDDWPPKETENWKTGRRRIGWEKSDEAWKWAGKCAYNATDVFRNMCYIRSPEITVDQDGQKEHEYWFLTELKSETHPIMVQGLCRKTECYKFKEVVKTTPAAVPPVATKLITIAQPTTTSENAPSAADIPQRPIVLPKWAYIIIAVLSAIVILMVAIFVTLCCYRQQAKTASTSRRRSSNQKHLPSVHSNQWQPNSFGYFGEKALPGISEDIYHTIKDDPLPPAPSSPTFPMTCFTPPSPAQNPDDIRSVPNVLYYDTTPRCISTRASRFSAFAPDNADINQPHTYEDTGLRRLPLTTADTPYFVPTGEEYGTIEEVHRSADSERENEKDQQKRRGNYDHIKLL